MGIYVSIRGWIEANGDLLKQVQALIDANPALLQYRDAWVFSTSGGGANYAFFGCNVREAVVPDLRLLLKDIAENVSEVDGAFQDFASGLFCLAHELREDDLDLEWRFRNGRFSESAAAFAQQSIQADPPTAVRLT